MSNDFEMTRDAGTDAGDQLCLMASRSCIMILDAALRVLPVEDAAAPRLGGSTASFVAMAAELRGLARRVMRTAQDFTAALPPQGIPRQHGAA